MEGDKRFRELIDRSFVEEVSEGERQLIHDHIRDCDGCKRYLELTARTIRGLREFTFTSEADSNAQVREILAHHTETMRQHNVQFKVWAAFAVAISMWVVYFASSQGRSLLASKGFLSTMPEALWFGLTFGVFTAAFFLALGYVYGDAKRRQMPAWSWVIAAFLIPNLIGFILYFVFRGPLLGPCSSCGKPIRGGEAFCSHCGCSQGSSIGRITADNRTI